MNVVTIIKYIFIAIVVVEAVRWLYLIGKYSWVIGGPIVTDGAEYFTKSSKFGNINKMVLIGPSGEIVLQPVGDIDSTINAVGDGVKADADAAIHALEVRDNVANELLKGLIKANKTNIKQHHESAVQKGAPYSIKMGEGHEVGAVGDDRYIVGYGDWTMRYNHDGPTAKWSLV